MEIDLFGSTKMVNGFRRRDLGQILPPVDDEVEEVEEFEEPALRPPPAVRRTLSLFSLRILTTSNLPPEIVRIGEDDTGWPDLALGNQEAGGQILLNPVNFRELLVRLVQALRDISHITWTTDILYVMQNLQLYNSLLRSLLEDLEFFQRNRAPEAPLQPAPGLHDLGALAQLLEALATDLAGNGHLVIHVDQDQYIPSLQQLNRFLNWC